MNRVPRRVEFIENSKERALRFMQRRSGLVNKVHELSTLCGVDACMIINAPKDINIKDEPVDLVWSSSSDSGGRVEKLIKKYKEASAEDRMKRLSDDSSLVVDKKRKAEVMLESPKENCEASKLSTWIESRTEHELRDLANDLEIKIGKLKRRRDLMKGKRMKRVIDSNPSSQADECLWSNGDDDNDLQPMYRMEPSYNPMVHSHSDNINHLGMVRNQMLMSRISLEDENNSSYQARTDTYVQPTAMIEQDVVNPMVQPVFDQHTPTGSEPQFFGGQNLFVDYNSVAQTEVNVSSASSSFMMNPAMVTTELPRSSVYDQNVLTVSVSESMSMQQNDGGISSQMEFRVSRQSSLPPLPPLMLDYSTNGHVSSEMQYSDQLGTLYRFQAQDTDRHNS